MRPGQVPLRRLLLRIMPPSWHPVPACIPRLRCRRAILRCRNGPTQADCSTLRLRLYAGGTVLLCGNGLTQAELFYFAAKKIRIGRRTLLRRGQVPLRRLLLRIMPPSWHPVPACTPRLCCRRAVLLAGTMALQAEPFYFAAKTLRRRNHSTLQQRPYAGGPFYFAATKIGIGRGIVAVTTFRRRNCSTLRQRKIESDAAPLRQRML